MVTATSEVIFTRFNDAPRSGVFCGLAILPHLSPLPRGEGTRVSKLSADWSQEFFAVNSFAEYSPVQALFQSSSSKGFFQKSRLLSAANIKSLKDSPTSTTKTVTCAPGETGTFNSTNPFSVTSTSYLRAACIKVGIFHLALQSAGGIDLSVTGAWLPEKPV